MNSWNYSPCKENNALLSPTPKESNFSFNLPRNSLFQFSHLNMGRKDVEKDGFTNTNCISKTIHVPHEDIHAISYTDSHTLEVCLQTKSNTFTLFNANSHHMDKNYVCNYCKDVPRVCLPINVHFVRFVDFFKMQIHTTTLVFHYQKCARNFILNIIINVFSYFHVDTELC